MYLEHPAQMHPRCSSMFSIIPGRSKHVLALVNRNLFVCTSFDSIRLRFSPVALEVDSMVNVQWPFDGGDMKEFLLLAGKKREK